MGKKKKIVVIVNCLRSFEWHRVALCHEIARSYDLTILLPYGDLPSKYEETFNIVRFPFSRKGTNPLTELKTLISLFLLIKKIKPDTLHHFTIKPVLYGTICARLLGTKKIINSVTGMGYVFTGTTLKQRVLQKVITFTYRFLMNSKRITFIFQNSFDRDFFTNQRMITLSQAKLIPGSGVKVENFSVHHPDNASPHILFSSRILWDKGFRELIEATHLLIKDKIKFKLLIAGPLDPENPAGVPENEFNQLMNSPQIEYLGYVKDMPTLLKSIDIICLPSYREGIPMALLEAMASGKPLITTDIPGCRELIFKDSPNGILVKVKDADSLKEGLKTLILDRELRVKMGENSRRNVEHFSFDKIAKQIIDLY